MQGKKQLNPEYGGDGKKEGDGAKLARPLVGFPGHFAPNDLLFYDGTQFPERYRHGAFIAFHGSTIRMPYSQAGYIVAFVPLRDGRPTGDWEVFADGFSPHRSDSEHRRCGGAADGPGAGARRVAVRQRQRQGQDLAGHLQGAPRRLRRRRSCTAMATRKASRSTSANPHEQNDIIGRRASVAGAKIYQTYCVACHQGDAKGDGARFPPLAATRWVSGNKQRLISVVLHGLQGEIEVEGKPSTA